MKKWLIIFTVMILALSPLASNTAMAEDEVTKPAVRISEERIQSPLGEELLDSPEGQFGKKLLKSQSTTHEKMKSPAVVTESLGVVKGNLSLVGQKLQMRLVTKWVYLTATPTTLSMLEVH
ncbi:hypothetical protein HB943_10815 [Listeria weihenstephanensis]|uniref:WxL domain-containing protein n=1 Tax=Listeria weihenstephanensis TaxID=1006155 RepID=A0A841Z9W4_9LIST|nr:hypothetical protein [Listeria weihenstephanensis]MBC1501093.1 hypothetical protein [Listeria weihenstephanensis]